MPRETCLTRSNKKSVYVCIRLPGVSVGDGVPGNSCMCGIEYKSTRRNGAREMTTSFVEREKEARRV